MTERNKVIWPEPFYESESRATAESDHCCFPLLPARIRTVLCAQDMSDFIRTAILTLRSKKIIKKGRQGYSANGCWKSDMSNFDFTVILI